SLSTRGTGARPVPRRRRAKEQKHRLVAHATNRFILFAPPLVRAILDGNKTMTRRLVSPQGRAAPQVGGCPFGLVGDRLWVREKWGYRDEFLKQGGRGPFVYAADGAPAGAKFTPWRPSLHMPRAACRLVLGITAARAERLQNITAV